MHKELYLDGFTITIDRGDVVTSITNKDKYGLPVMLDVVENCLISCGYNTEFIKKAFINKAEKLQNKGELK